MPGYRLRRQNRTVAIDTDYFNLALRQKGSVRTSFLSQSNSYVRAASITVATDQPVLAVRAPYPVCMTHSTNNGNGTTTFTLRAFSTGDFDFDVEFWLFDLPKYGMMFASAGKFITRNPSSREVVFDSRMKYLKVQEFVVPSSNDETRNYGRYPAVVLCNRRWARLVQPMTPTTTREQTATSAVWTEGNAVKSGMRDLYFQIRQHYDSDRYINYYGGNPQMMVVDVQDY